MSETYSHNCIKCQTQYTDDDPDAYYCNKCNEERKMIAKKIDKQFINRTPSKKVPSLLKEYDAAPKVRGFIIAKLNP